MAGSRDKRSIESLDDLYREAIITPASKGGHLQNDLSEDFLSGDVYSGDNSAVGGYGQAVMHSLAAKNPAWHGKEIAIAADKMRVTFKVRGGDPIDTYQLKYGLEQLGVSHGVDWQALVAVEELSKLGRQGEVVIATGTAAEPRRRVLFPDVRRVIDVDGSFFWLTDGVTLDGPGLRALLTAETLASVEQQTVPAKAVAAGTVLARIHQDPKAKSGTNVLGDLIEPVEDILPERGDNVRYNEKDGTCEAGLHGYLVLEGNTMSVMPPIWVSPDHLGVYYVNLPQTGVAVFPTANDLIDTLLDMGMVEGVIRRGLIEKLAGRLTQGQSLSARTVKIAEAVAPRPGRNAQFTFCKELAAKDDNVQSEGTLDLRERNAVVAIKAGTLIAKKVTATKGIAGKDLLGETLETTDGRDQTILYDDTIRIEERDGQIFYHAQRDGNLRYKQNRLTIAEIFTVAGNVDSNIGNIDRQEDLLINGSVMAGFSVRSQGNIAIAGSVYNGCKVVAGGDVTVGEGIIGAETRVVALGHLRAVFIQEAEVIVKGDALVRSYLYNAVLRANGTITVVNSQEHGHKSGRVINGLTCASRGIVVSRVGRHEQTNAVLAILPDPEYSGQIKKLEDESKNCRESIARISRTLPFKSFDSASIKRVMAQMTAEKRDSAIRLLTTFNNLIKRQQNIETLSKEVHGKIVSGLRNSSIQILEEICRGSELQFGEKKLVITADLGSTTFSLQGGEIV